ncbi:unnamed protein product [Lasius platythorax]|uniref:PRANC domain-containing protein n=1 Tax=Lasius platythorax TaxID=488582 RepID=A0AAV2NRR4_9HYME
MDDQYISYSLISAVRDGRLERVRELISFFDLSHSQAGYVLLCDAVENKHIEVSKLLLTNGSRVNSKNKTPSNTPLHFAVLNGDIEIVKLLLDSDANIDAKNQYGRTPFHNAVENKKMEIIELLLNRGADVNARNSNSITPLHLAVEKGNNEEIIKLLLSRGANVDAKGYLQNVEHLLKHGAHVNSAYTSTSREGYTPLHLAVEKGSEEIIKLLLSRGANVDAKGIDGITSLHIAAERGYLQIVEHLLKRGAHVNSVYTSTSREGYTPLHLAVEKDSEEIIKLLLSRGANVDAKGKDGITSLHIAVERGYLQIVEHLLKHGAYVNFAYTSTSREGYTPLHLAVETGHENVVKLLLEYGANVDYYNPNCCEIIDEILKHHIVKIKTANLYVSRKNLLSIDSNYEIRDFQNKCEKEMASMRSEKIGSSNTIFYDIVTKSINQIAILLENKNIVQILRSDDYKIKFPIYASMIDSHFRRGGRRKELLEQVNKNCYSIFPEMPYICTQKVLSYLSDEDLRILIDVCQSTNVSSSDTNIDDVVL